MYKRVTEIFPITYGCGAPAGFGGKPDKIQQRFNRVTHLAQWHHDASYAEFNQGMVIDIPEWAHWLAFNELDASLSKGEVMHTLAYFKAVLDAVGRAIGCKLTRRDYHARMLLRNEQVFEEWLADYAERMGMTVECARTDVMEARREATRSANGVGCNGAPCHDDARWQKVPEIEDVCLDGYDSVNPVCHDLNMSYEHTREVVKNRIVAPKAPRKAARKPATDDSFICGCTTVGTLFEFSSAA